MEKWKIRKNTQKVIRPKLPLDKLRFDFRLKIRTQRKQLHLVVVSITFHFCSTPQSGSGSRGSVHKSGSRGSSSRVFY